jgi:hypothetical protein
MQGRLRPSRPLTRHVQLALPALEGGEAARHPDPGLSEIRRRARRELSYSFHPALGCAVSPARASIRPRTRSAPLFRLALGRCASYAKGKGWHSWHSGAFMRPASMCLVLCACLHRLNCLPAHTPKGVCVGAVNGCLGSVEGKPVITWVNGSRMEAAGTGWWLSSSKKVS